jgi:4-amino-4-deoxy-L-arabinose transferase-like glycosyltransferase
MTTAEQRSKGLRWLPPRSSVLLALVLLALLPRGLFLVDSFDRVEFNHLLVGLDQHAFHENALRIRAGDLLLAEAPYAQGPLYSYLLASLYTVLPAEVRTVRIAQALVGVASCVLIFLIASRWFTVWIAFACAAFYSLYDFSLFMESNLLRASTIGFLYLLLLWGLVRFDETGKASWMLGSGLVLGLAIAARPNSVLMLAALVPALIISAPERARSPGLWAGFALAVALPVLPFVLRNLHLGHPALHLSGQGLGVFVAGNMPDSRGVGWLISAQGDELIRAAEGDALRVLRGVVVAVAQQPGDWLAVQLQKLHALVASYEIPNNVNFYLWKENSWVLRASPVSIHVIAALFLPGFFLGMRRRGRRALLYGHFLGVLLTILPFYVIARFRLPAVGFMCIFAGFALEEIFLAGSERKLRRLSLLLAGVVAAAIVTTSPVEDEITPLDYRNLALVYEYNDRFDEAEALYRRAFEARPQSMRAARFLVELYLRRGDLLEAERTARRHLQLRSSNREMRLLLAMAHRRAGDLDAAEALLTDLVGQSFSRLPDAHYELGLLQLERKQYPASLASFRRALRLNPELTAAAERIASVEALLAP